MSKKNFGGFDSLLGKKEDTSIKEDNKNEFKQVTTSIVTDSETLRKLKGIAYLNLENLKDTMNDAFKQYIANYEATQGNVLDRLLKLTKKKTINQ